MNRRRLLITGVLLLLLGAIVNVAVAWICAKYVPVEHVTGGNTEGPVRWVFYIHEGFGSRQIMSRRVFILWGKKAEPTNLELMPRWSRIQSPPPKLDTKLIEGQQGYFYEDARGWPCLAMKSQFHSRVVNRSTWRRNYESLDGIALNNKVPKGFSGFATASMAYH